MENNAVKNGLLYGGVSIVISLVMYLVDPALMFKSVSMFLGLAIGLFFMIKAAREEKALNEGILTYGEAVKTTFIVLVIGSFFSSIYMFVMMKYIDPSLVDQMMEVQIATAEWSAEMFGAPEEALDEMRETLEEQDMTPTIWKTLSQFVMSTIMSLIISLIVSAFVKKNPSLE